MKPRRKASQRRVDCRQYGKCLTQAAHENAPDLPCQGCSQYQLEAFLPCLGDWLACARLALCVLDRRRYAAIFPARS